jgi:23S rRNA pseudouridine1911/1915/1917 synthase
VHADAIGHPLVGDDRYGTAVSPSTIVAACPRPFLHARKLGFEHPVTHDWMEFSSPLPPDLVIVLEGLGASAPGG